MILQKCRRHPSARFMATCPGCAQDLYDLQERNRVATEAALAAKVHAALGLHGRAARPEERAEGEAATRVAMWSQIELNAVFERVGGTVTSRQVERGGSNIPTTVETEITVTVDLPGIGRVEVFTDWYEDYTAIGGGRDLPVMRALTETPAAV